MLFSIRSLSQETDIKKHKTDDKNFSVIHTFLRYVAKNNDLEFDVTRYLLWVSAARNDYGF